MNLDAFLTILMSPWGLGLLGLCVGSFLNVVIHRIPLMLERAWREEGAQALGVPAPSEDQEPLTLSKPASRCPHCGHQIRWFENIPLISWLVLRGKCSACKAPISIRYPLIELATAALFVGCWWRFGEAPTTLLWCGFVAMLLAAAAIDWDTTLLPDNLTQPLLWGGVIVATLGWGQVSLTDAVWGATAGYMSLWSVYWLFKLTTGKEGMGYGDFKLLAALGAWLGWKMILPILLASSLIGAIVGIGLKLTAGLREGRYVPYGPFLAGAGFVVLYAGADTVMGWLGWA